MCDTFSLFCDDIDGFADSEAHGLAMVQSDRQKRKLPMAGRSDSSLLQRWLVNAAGLLKVYVLTRMQVHGLNGMGPVAASAADLKFEVLRRNEAHTNAEQPNNNC